VIATVHFILYVRHQALARNFYRQVLALAPRLDVPGMTEFALSDTAVLGLMPESGAVRLLGPHAANPATASGVPRAEVYLLVTQPELFHARALSAGATELSPMQLRAWGHRAAYSQDADGHVLAFAAPCEGSTPPPT